MAEQALGQAKSQWQMADLQRKQQNLEAGLSVVGAGAQIGAAAAGASDIRLKENIKFSHKENGYNIYEFNYKSDPSSRYTGVMAQEIMEVNPSAVVEEDGYYKVYYDMLGITMKKLN